MSHPNRDQAACKPLNVTLILYGKRFLDRTPSYYILLNIIPGLPLPQDHHSTEVTFTEPLFPTYQSEGKCSKIQFYEHIENGYSSYVFFS